MGTEPIDLAPLYDAVDPDAVDSLVEHAQRIEDAGTHQLWVTRGSTVASEATANVESETPPRRPAETTPPERSSPAVSPVRR
ncbi:HalOD1 output domain-containing protein [Natrinema altunense]|uniref:HalOD1 output domain-containing protein n=1 Tax=Natrinema altunense TaxID=222984 RepID=UPI0030F45576